MPHFNFQVLHSDGTPKGEPLKCITEAGVILQCPSGMELTAIKHMCGIARSRPNYPVDLALWEGPENFENLVWSARISYEDNATGMHKIRSQAE